MQYRDRETDSGQEDRMQPAGVAVLALLGCLWSVVVVATGGLMVMGNSFFGLTGAPVLGIGGLAFFLGLVGFLVAWGLWNRMAWAWRAAVACALLGLLAVPVGTVMSVVLLLSLLKPQTKKSFR